MPLIPRQFFPASDRPGAAGRPDPAAERLDLRDRDTVEPVRRGARRTIPTSRAGAPMSARVRSASTCRSTCSWPNAVLRPGGGRRQGRARRASGCRPKLEKVLAEDFPNVDRPRLAAGARPAGRLAGAVPRRAGRIRRVVRSIALDLAQVVAASPDTLRRPISTGSSRRARCASASTRIRRACWA